MYAKVQRIYTKGRRVALPTNTNTQEFLYVLSLFLLFLGRVNDGHFLRVRLVLGVRVCVVRGHGHLHSVVI